ncbi:MAG: hypothetical protein ACRDOD_02635 [Streptosporangiaceae bacterium]
MPVTVLQRAQMTQTGAHHGRHRLTCRLSQIGGYWLMTSSPFAVTRHPQAEPFPAPLFSDRGGSCEDRLRG